MAEESSQSQRDGGACIEIIAEAVAARSGWKRILERCVLLEAVPSTRGRTESTANPQGR